MRLAGAAHIILLLCACLEWMQWRAFDLGECGATVVAVP
jgi:hypothetical protein